MCKLCALISRSTLLFGSTPVSLPKNRQSPIAKWTPSKIFELAPNIKTSNQGADPSEPNLFFCLKYWAKPGLHDKRNFFHEIASCAKFFLSRPVLAKISQQEKKGLGPFQLSKFFNLLFYKFKLIQRHFLHYFLISNQK